MISSAAGPGLSSPHVACKMSPTLQQHSKQNADMGSSGRTENIGKHIQLKQWKFYMTATINHTSMHLICEHLLHLKGGTGHF